MSDRPGFQDLFRRARDQVLILNGKLSREVVERPGSDANIMLAAAAAAADDVVSQLVQVESGLFLDSAVGAALDRLVFDRYGLVRKSASAAVGQVEFTTTVNNPSPFSIPVNTILQAAGGVQYITTIAITFPASTTGPITVPVRSLLAGSDQQAKPGTITNIVSQIPGQPTDLVVTNSLATAGADDAEQDDSLRNRARQFFTTARRGTISALIQGALAVPGVQTANAFEVIDSMGNPARAVELVVSDAFTLPLATLNPTPGTYAAQAQVFAQTVFTALADVRAAGIFIKVTVAQVIMQPVILILAFVAGADTDAVSTQARALTVSYVNNLNPGASFIKSDLSAILRNIPGLFFTGNEVISPSGDVIPGPLQVLRTTLALVSTGGC